MEEWGDGRECAGCGKALNGNEGMKIDVEGQDQNFGPFEGFVCNRDCIPLVLDSLYQSMMTKERRQ